MIPSIETIVEDLLAGRMTAATAIEYLHMHAEDAGRTLRDDFAAAALQGWLTSFGPGDAAKPASVASFAYECADAMLAERENG